MGKTSFHKPSKVCRHNFGCLVLLCQTTSMLAGRPYSSARTSYLTEQLSHMRSPDHIIKVQSGRSLLVIINAHFEPGPRLRSLRERLWRFPIGLDIPKVSVFLLAMSTFARLRKVDSMLPTKPSQKAIQGRRLSFEPSCPTPWKKALPNFTRKDAAADGTLRTLSRIDRAFINVPMAEAHDFRCHSHVLDNLGELSIPNDHVAIRIDVRKPQDHCGTSGQVLPWMSKHPLFCTILKRRPSVP